MILKLTVLLSLSPPCTVMWLSVALNAVYDPLGLYAMHPQRNRGSVAICGCKQQ